MNDASSEMRGYAVFIVNEEAREKSGLKKRTGARNEAKNLKGTFSKKTSKSKMRKGGENDADNLEVTSSTKKSKFKKRKGAARDADNMQRAFCTKLKFEWLNQRQYSRNMVKSEWRHSKKEPPQNCDCITCKIQQTNHEKSECFLLVISSHGREHNGEQIVRFSDGGKVKISEIIETLNDDNCPSLKGKPRILILQACRTKNSLKEEKRDDPGFKISVEGLEEEMGNLNVNNNGRGSADENAVHNVGGNKSDQSEESSEESDADPEEKSPADTDQEEIGEESDPDSEEENHVDSNQRETGDKSDPEPEIESSGDFLPLGKIPNNFLIVYPTAEGKRSKRNTKEGSWFITDLCNVIDEHDFETNPEMNFLQKLTKATGLVAKRETKGKNPGLKNVPCTVHTLTQPLIFKVVDESASTLNNSAGKRDDMTLDIPEPEVEQAFISTGPPPTF